MSIVVDINDLSAEGLQRQILHKLGQIADGIIVLKSQGDQIMSNLQDVKDSQAREEADIEALSVAVNAAINDIQALNVQTQQLNQTIADLQAQIAAGGTVTAEDLAGLKATSDDVASKTEALTANLTAAVQPPPAEPQAEPTA